MPLTFLAHQAPVLPIARRWPGRVDGIALVIGSMAPDMAYVLAGSRFSLWAHGFPAVVLFSLPVTLAVSWLIARVVSPVLWDHLPDAGPFRLHDFRALARHRFVWHRAALSALVGALSHILVDHFTHAWGFMAVHVDWYSTVIGEALGREWTAYRIAQYVGHVGGAAACLWLLARYGRERWLAVGAAEVAPYPVSGRSTVVLVGVSTVGLVTGLVWVVTDPSGRATDVLRVAASCFAGLVAGCTVLRGARRSPAPSRGAGRADRTIV